MSSSLELPGQADIARMQMELAKAKMEAAQAAAEAAQLKLAALEAQVAQGAPSKAVPPPVAAPPAAVSPPPAAVSPPPAAVAPPPAVFAPPAAAPKPAPVAAAVARAVATPVAVPVSPKAQLAETAANADPGEIKPREPLLNQRLMRRLFPTASGFGVSLFIHAILLVILGSLYVVQQVTPAIFDLVTIPSKDEDELVEELDENVNPTQELTTVTSVSSEAVQTGPAVSSMQLASAAPTTSEVVATTSDGPPVRVADISVSGPVTVKTLSNFVPADIPGEPQAVVDGYQQAMDRLTQEILMMLEHGKVMVVWLFDQSESMKDDQKEIRDRFDKVYHELGLG